MVTNYHLASKGVRVMKVMTLPTVSSTDEGSSELEFINVTGFEKTRLPRTITNI